MFLVIYVFKSKDKLDMSMGLSNISAQDVVNNLCESQLKLIIKTQNLIFQISLSCKMNLSLKIGFIIGKTTLWL